jgi:anti-sigma factor RsiW
MTCARIQHLLPAYSTDGLREGLRRAVAAHLATCPACAAELAALERAAAAFATLPAPEPPDLWPEIAAAIATPQPRWAPVWRPVLAGALSLTLLTGGAWWAMRQPVLPVAPVNRVSAEYAAQYRLARINDPLADRAALGLLVAEGK